MLPFSAINTAGTGAPCCGRAQQLGIAGKAIDAGPHANTRRISQQLPRVLAGVIAARREPLFALPTPSAPAQ